MTLHIYNVLTRQKEIFTPVQPGKVSMYVCGPTVYDYPHIGHAKTYVNFDVVVRYLRHCGYDVLYVQNITDVGHLVGDRDEGEDKIQKKARQESSLPMQIVEQYTKIYFDNMDALNVARPDISPRASGHIPEQIAMIKVLIEKDHAYVVNGSVYFDVTSWDEYGKLSGRQLDEQKETIRLEKNSDKQHAADFALWKAADSNHIMQWDSPWGVGYPGWHIECSAMAEKYLGETFDIHGGGIDNIFPHNDCEIAQSECAHGSSFSNYWMLTGSLTRDGVKMSKSLGNGLSIIDALDTYRPESIRYFMLTSHYSNPIDFSDEALAAADKGWKRIWSAVSNLRERERSAPTGESQPSIVSLIEEATTTFLAKMDDDFNAPAAIASLQALTHKINALLNDGTPYTASSLQLIDTFYRTLGGEVLGIVPDEMVEGGNGERENDLIRLLIDLRDTARQEKNWAASDQIRDQLQAMGISLLDGADGTTWQIN